MQKTHILMLSWMDFDSCHTHVATTCNTKASTSIVPGFPSALSKPSLPLPQISVTTAGFTCEGLKMSSCGVCSVSGPGLRFIQVFSFLLSSIYTDVS